ncbi:hypothetical protein [Microbacterium ulmi]|uniref:Uncharacterized protein n=1 Tax=Microbacterium ulmi TaxID=179095 RepID=A0A7Y2M3D9_9MICO|nr:hypothetical protein [Microbacterium ulmi]NII70105.1 hypothetical protein [Microbacterium ulmi]NNH04353.1 hypothetical protein [Microbacterium ulmi]
MTASAPRIAMLLPEGWVRIPIAGEGTTSVDDIVRRAVARIDPRRRDLARVTLRTRLEEAVRGAERRGLHELVMPVAETNGVFMPVSLAIGPLPRQPSALRSVEDVLVGFASATPGALAVEIGGALGIRFLVDQPARNDASGALEAPPVRLASYIVSPGPGHPEWLVFSASIMIPDAENSAELVAVMEFVVDSLLATVAFEENA